MPMAMRSGLVGLALSFLTQNALATTYYVRPGGSDSNSGTSSGSAWATIGKANSTVVAGDLVIVYAGTYSHFPNPSRSGTSYRSRITYVGDVTSPASVIVPGGTLRQKFVTLSGMTMTSGVTLDETAQYDSVAYCLLGPSLRGNGADDNVVVGCVVSGYRAKVVFDDGRCPAEGVCDGSLLTQMVAERDTIDGCTLTLGAGVVTEYPFMWRRVRNAVVRRNRVLLIRDNVDPNVHREFYYVKGCRFSDNHWAISNESGGTLYGFVLRDSSEMNVFSRDTVECTGSPVDNLMSSPGNNSRSVRNNNYEGCVFVNRTSNPMGFFYHNGCNTDTLRNCVFVGAQQAFNFATSLPNSGVTGAALIDHCTFFSPPSSLGTVQFREGGATWQGTLRFTNNIVYGLGNALGVASWHYWPQESGKLTSNNNLYAYYRYGSKAGDLSIGCSGCNAASYEPGPTSAWCTTYGQDCNSRYGSPLFMDSTLASFDVHLRAGSRALGLASDGSDAGAYPFGLDVTPPDAITTLDTAMVLDQGVVLRWIAPGDDGAVGTAQTYDLRYSQSPIDAANFSSATPVSVPPVPSAAGTLQNYVLLGLAPNTVYYFAIKSRDEAGNWSALSNVLMFRTSSADLRPPAAVQDLGTGF